MKKVITASVVLLGLVSRAAATAEEPPVYLAPRVTQPPIVDGRLDDEAWKAAPVITGLINSKDKQPARFATEFRLVHDTDALYVAVLAKEPEMARLKHRTATDVPSKVWNDDCVEVFLDPQATRRRYYQHIVNAGGLIACSYCGDFSADLPATAVAGRTAEAWTLEVRIPFSTFGAAPNPGERWGMNLTRGREPKADGERREDSLWSPTGGNHGSPGRFGYLVFAGIPGERPPRERPDMATIDRLLDQARADLHGHWRWSEADVSFEARAERARRLVALSGVLARFPDTRLLYSIRPAIRDQQTMPWSVPDPGGIGGGIDLVACRGEFESAAVELFATTRLDGVRLGFSELRSPAGDTLSASIADPYHVICWYQNGVGTIHAGATAFTAELLMKDSTLVTVDPRSRRNELHFDSIPTDAATLKPIDIPAFESRQIWITYRAPRDAKPGRYAGKIVVEDAAGTCATIPVSLRVPAWDLARSPMLHGLYYGRRAPKLQTVEDEKAFLKVLEEEIRDQVEHGCNVVATYVHTGPLPSDPSPFATAQRISDILKKYGVTGTPFFSVVDFVGSQSGSDQLAKVTRHAREASEWAARNGHPAYCFQGRDEASGDALRSQRPAWEAARAGGGKMWVACGVSYFPDMGDILDCPVVSGTLVPSLAEKVHANGFKILSYGNPQAGVERPEVYRRNYGLALRAAGYDGSIDYEYRTMDDKSAWDDFDHAHYRDHNFAYPAVGKPIDTIQFEGWREAVDDLRYAATLEQAIRAARADGREAEPVKEADEWLAGLTGREELGATRAELIRRIDLLLGSRP